jgi:MSHA biogenesis protein MshN
MPARRRPAPKPAITAEPRPQPVVASAIAGETAGASNSAVEETHTTTTATTARIKKVPRKPSPQALFAQHLANARNALAEGDMVIAEKLVQQAMRLAPGNAAATELLLAVQLRRGDTDAAIATLREGLVRDPANAAYATTLARLLTARGEHQAAIDYLRAALGRGRSDGAALALLAGLERRVGDHESAAAHYVDALAQDHSVAVWWMGLGVSLERLRQPAEAHAAFSEAQRIGGLDREVAAFVEQRLASLKAAAAR